MIDFIKKTVVFILLLIANFCIGQSKTDSLQYLNFQDYLKWVAERHPLAIQAALIQQSANAGILAARGNFDPKLFYEFNNKRFDDKNYFSINSAGVKIPTWFGIETKVGYDNNSGLFLNNENKTPNNGLVYAQISVPLLQGFLTDDRRTVLKQAELFKQSTASEINIKLNELYFQASKAYLEWMLASLNLKTIKDAYDISSQRLNAVKRNAILGDRPLIDTVEALIQQQDRFMNLKQAELDLQNKKLYASSFLWMENNTPVILNNNINPNLPDSSVTKVIFPNIPNNLDEISTSIDKHPFIQNYEYKIKQLNAEKRLKKEKLKPSLNLLYNPLVDPSNNNASFFNNYKWGIAFNFPVLIRKERGELRQTTIKLLTADLELQNKKNELLVKARISIQENKNIKDQLEIYKKNVTNYEKLWIAEKISFENGESSLFMINSREMSYMNAKLKLNELDIKFQKSLLEVNYTLGQIQF